MNGWVLQVASRVFRPGSKFRFGWQPESHRVYYGSAVDGDERVIDEVRAGMGTGTGTGLMGHDPRSMCSAYVQVLLMSMLSPRSYTCEDVVELHCHGGGLCAQRVLQVNGRTGVMAPCKPIQPLSVTPCTPMCPAT